MKGKILFMTVGTGQGRDGYKDLSDGLLTSIKYNSPSKIIFFATDQSLITVEYIIELYNKRCDDELDNYEIVNISNPDDFNTCYEVISDKVNEYWGNNIVFDYTSGTKTMSVTIATIAIINHYDMTIVIGKRGEKGVVITNTEEIKTQNPYQAYDKLYYDSFKEHFNNCRFESADFALSMLVSWDNEKVSLLHKLNNFYNDWDKFHHVKPEFDTKNELFSDISKQLGLNIKSLSIITKENHDFKRHYIIADMLNNAKRRFKEGRYDDATGRLYRTLEYIAQSILLSKDYEIDTSDIILENLKEKVLDDEYLSLLEAKKNSDGKIKLGLSDSYYLLHKLGNDVGDYYIENYKKYLDILNVRNNSLLAHGEQPVTKENYINFEVLVYDIARLLDEKMDQYVMETEFPKF